tara:strand:+ start:9716 stop:10384 length:669 start_codon:yes stop_codon:yes gene_type:complete
VSKKISIIITCYNLERYITRAINSCLNQNFDQSLFEVIVVDDGSQDNSWDAISLFGNMDDILKPIKLDENKGVSYASNIALSVCTGEYVMKVDGDDFINSNMIMVMCQVLDHNPELGFVYCDHIVITDDQHRTMRINTLEKLLDHGAGIMFRTDYIKALGGWNENVKTRDDMDLLLRYLKNFDGYHLRIPFYRYNKREGSLSSMLSERTEEAEKIKRGMNNV